MYKQLIACGVAGLAIAMAGSAMATSPITVTASGVGVESSTVKLSKGGTETFDSVTPTTGSNTENFSATFGAGSSKVTGTYTNFEIKKADVDGGAGDAGYYAASRENQTGLLTLNSEVNYFGIWASALDPGTQIAFYDTNSKTPTVAIATFNESNSTLTESSLSSILKLSSAYDGYPATPNIKGLSGQNSSQPYVYLNFVDTAGTFNEVKFTDTQAAFEGDNETVGTVAKVSAAPEPASWALMMVGVGAAGAGLRGSRRRRSAALSAAAA